ncbi:hypothetical protein B0A50_00682 [Salinomyces thailandicus]|uniref:Fibronectin type-III domain-containing protein n=1 Tax=Salinomyces thailandicus TaxID=706561 RepID=A0A4V5N5T1_9PEZI|nr:hypothetical protein B0A50_00682 [Salinomyces thailandica]
MPLDHDAPAATSTSSLVDSIRAHFFVAAAAADETMPLSTATSHTANEILANLPVAFDPVYLSNLMTMLQTLALPLALWFKPLTITCALVWLLYRTSLVLQTPLPALAALLGFDIPTTPLTDLAAIKADGAILHWSLPGGKGRHAGRSRMKFEVWLNGVVVDTVGMGETAVTITGLQPASFYVVRVGLVNEAEFGSRSTPIRFRTKPASSGDFFVPAANTMAEREEEAGHDGSSETLPTVRLYRGLKGITPAAIEAAPMTREPSSGGLGPKRSLTGRRPSPAVLSLDRQESQTMEESEGQEGGETIQQLTERLDAIRRETDEAEKQAKEEEEEELRLKDELAQERDTLKGEVMEKERASRHLKREVNTLERQNTAAQNERTKQERALQAKRLEREKLRDDLVRWAVEVDEMKRDVERIRLEKTAHVKGLEKEKESLRSRLADDTSAMRTLDDEVREKNTKIKQLERSMKNASPDFHGGVDAPETSLVQQFQHDAEEDRQWNIRRASLHQQYVFSMQKLEAAKRFHAEQARYLESIRAQRRRDEELAQQYTSPPPAVRKEDGGGARVGIMRGDSQRSGRRGVQRGDSLSESPLLNAFPPASTTGGSPFGPAMGGAAMASPFQSAPFLNIHNGMTIAGPSGPPPEEVGMGMSEEEKEKLTGGALMSPGAGAELLPADLFASEGDNQGKRGAKTGAGPEGMTVQPLPGLGSLPGLGGLSGLAGTGSNPPHQQEVIAQGPVSPGSNPGSRSPSVFASPQASQHNLHGHVMSSPDSHGFFDADRRSVRSNRSGRATSGGVAQAGSRFSSMFGIKPRLKAGSADEGSLALGKANSMPRQDQGISGLDSATRKRNSSISATTTPATFGGELGGLDGASDVGPDIQSGHAPSKARRAFGGMGGFFGRDKGDSAGGWPASFTSNFSRRPGSPRPGSTHSNELPRPSFDSSRWGVDTWPASDATAGARSSPLSFGGSGWPAPGQQPNPRIFGSRHPSRRPSVQYGASGPPEDIIEDEDSDEIDTDIAPHLAPIGTKPSKKVTENQAAVEYDWEESSATPKLNPAAKDFKSFFGIKSREKAPSAGPSGTPNLSSAATMGLLEGFDDSPPASRKSRDARSLTTTESSIAESGRTSNDLARTPSYSNSDATGPSPLIGSSGKESFMQKITRKSSSGKFSLPTFNRRDRSSRALDPTISNSPSIPASHAEDDEEPLSASVGSLREGKDKGDRGSGRSWSSVLKLGKKEKRGGETPSVSELSMVSTEEGTEEDEDV